MNISFNIENELGDRFISASKWMMDRPDLSNEKIIKKNIKQYIGHCVDDYNKFLILADSASLVANLAEQVDYFRNKCLLANENYEQAKIVIDSTYKKTDVGPD